MKKLWIAFMFLSIMSYGQWTSNPAVNTIIDDSPGAHYVPKTVVTPEGNYFFSWYGGLGNLDMNLTYFDRSGTQIWPSAMKVSTHPQNSWVDDYTLLSDLEGNAIVVFSDIRDGGKSTVVYKVDAEGNQLWGEDGIFFSLWGSDEYQPKASVAPDNSVYVYYSTNFSSGAVNVIKVHHIQPDGTLTWGANGKTFNNELDANWTLPSGFANEDNSLSIGFFRETGSFPATQRWIKCFRIDSEGEFIYPDTVVTNAGGISAWDDLMMWAPGDGSAYFTWHDDRYYNNTYEVYAQGVDAEGNTLWTPSGVLLGIEGSGPQIYEIPAGLNESNEFIVFWNRLNSTQSVGSLVYQRISAEGELLETNAGKTILPFSERMQNGLSAKQIGNNTYFLYTYFLEGSSIYTSYNMLALDEAGEMLWENPVELTNSQLDRTHADLSDFYENMAVVCWEDNFGGNARVTAQNIFTDGALGSSPVAIEEQELSAQYYFIGSNTQSKTLYLKDIENGDILRIYNLIGQEITNQAAQNQVELHRFLKGSYIAVLYRDGLKIEDFKFLF